MDQWTTNDINYLDVDGDAISYLPTARYDAMVAADEDPWTSRYRQSGRPGRVLKRVMTEETVRYWGEDLNADFEYIANQLVANNVIKNLVPEMVESVADITYAYHPDNHDYDSGLGSCMATAEKANIAGQFYGRNETSRLVMLRHNNRVIGRAVVWTLENNRTVLDRCYGKDGVRLALRDFARKVGWVVRADDTAPTTLLLDINGKPFKSAGRTSHIARVNFTLPVKSTKLPWLDTFKWFSKGSLQNVPQYYDHVFDGAGYIGLPPRYVGWRID